MRPHLALCLAGSLLMVVEAVGEIVQPYLMKFIIDVGVPNQDVTYIAMMGAGMILAAALMMAAQIAGVRLCVQASMRFGRDLRRAVFAKMQALTLSGVERYGEPSLVMRLTNDITQIQNVTLSALKIWLKAPLLMVMGCVMAFYMDQELSVILIVSMPVLAVAVVSLSLLSFPRFEAMQRGLDALNERVQENLVGMRVVKAYARGGYESKRFGEANESLRKTSARAYTMSVSITPVITLIMNTTVVLVVWFGGNRILRGGMDVGTLQAYAAYVLEILAALMMVGLVIVESTRAVASFRRVSEVLAEETPTPAKARVHEEAPDAAQHALDAAGTSGGRIEFQDVSFRYFKNNPTTVLEHISLVIEPGQTVGIIGSTGSGKSTLVDLVARLYDVDEGCVLVDGLDVRSYDVRELRGMIGFVPQRNQLFSGTIGQNLRWGDASASDEDVRAAASLAQADEFVSQFDQGYDTPIERGGTNVSGGQRQRLCIARALVCKPRILVFDDSTSAVDLATERRIRTGLAHSYGGTTKLVVAQRIDAVREADTIVVMDEGRIVGKGTHEELLATCAAYAEIAASQEMGGVA